MLRNFSKARVLVIGDIIVDKYISGKITKMSFEAPIPVVEVNSTELKLGGASLVFENAVLLGANGYLLGVAGNDDAGIWMKKRFKTLGASLEGIISEKSLSTPLRTRVTVDKYQVSRFDDSPISLNSNLKKKIIETFKHLIPKVDCIVICDYGMGIMTDDVIKSIIEIISKTTKKIIISPVENHLKYKHSSFVYRIKLKDALKLLDMKNENFSTEEICNKLHQLLKCKKIILTKGDNGLSIYENGEVEDITPTHHISRDITSVGEVLVSTFAVSYASGKSFNESCIIGNVAAGTVVEKFGSKNITKQDLKRSLREYFDLIIEK